MLCNALANTIYQTISPYGLPIVLCIGSDRVTGDCFGPIVGDFLVNQHKVNAFVYGTLSSPITALNLKDAILFIKGKHPRKTVFAIDSSLGREEEVGCLRVLNDGIYPGAGVGKRLPKAGDFALTATVAPMGSKNDLYGVRLSMVQGLAAHAAKSISIAFNKIQQSNFTLEEEYSKKVCVVSI